MDVTTKQLIAAAKNLNKVLGAKPPLATSGKDEQIISDLKEAATLLEPSDSEEPTEESPNKITSETAETLGALGIKGFKKAPAAKKAAPKEEKTAPKSEKEKKESKKLAKLDNQKELKKMAKAAKEKKVEAKKETPSATKKKETPATPRTKYTRVQSFCDALKGKAKTVEEIAGDMHKLYQLKNKEANKETKINSIIWAATDYLAPLVLLGFVSVKNGKYQLLKDVY